MLTPPHCIKVGVGRQNRGTDSKKKRRLSFWGSGGP